MAGDFDCCTEPINRQEHPMTSPTQRRHDEILGRLDALIDAVQSTTARDHLHRLLAEESAAERQDEPVDVTEEPHKVHDHGIDPTCREHVGSDGLLRGECVDTAPDVDPDERQSHPGVLWDKIDALTEDVERLTRERDEAQERHELLRAGVNGLRHIYRHIRNPRGETVSADLTHTLNLDDQRAK